MPPDVQVCVTLPDKSGFCENTLSDKEVIFTPDEWEMMQVGRFSMTAKGFAEYQKFVESACEMTHCSSKQKKLQKKILKGMSKYD